MHTESSADPRIVRTKSDVVRAALKVLVDEGWDAVTHARVAKEAGYSRATIYTHWPEQMDLVRDAFSQYGEMPHHSPTGDVKADLAGEIVSFCRAMVERKLDRALATLADRAQTTAGVAEIRNAFVFEGERPMRETVPNLTSGPAAEAVVQMLCGMVTHSVLLHGKPPTDEVIQSAVEIVLRGVPQA